MFFTPSLHWVFVSLCRWADTKCCVAVCCVSAAGAHLSTHHAAAGPDASVSPVLPLLLPPLADPDQSPRWATVWNIWLLSFAKTSTEFALVMKTLMVTDPKPVVFSLAALLQQNLLSLPSQSQTSLLQHQPGLALTPQVLMLISDIWLLSCNTSAPDSRTKLTCLFSLRCLSDPGHESLWSGRTVHGEPHGHVSSADAQTHVSTTAGGTQRSGGTGTICKSVQTKTHQTGLHSGNEEK